MELLDTSAWKLRHHPEARDWFFESVINGDVALCDQIVLELLHQPSSAKDYEDLRVELAAMPFVAMAADDWQRAREVHRLLVARGRAEHKSVRIPDLLIAATAERYGITLVHYDQDFDMICSATRQRARWLLPRGSA